MQKFIPKKLRVRQLIVNSVAIIYILALLLPIYSMVLISIVPEDYYLSEQILLYPGRITWDAYGYVFSNPTIWKSIGITAFITIVGTLYNLILTITAAYVLINEFPGKKIFVAFLFIAMFFDGGLIANYLIISKIGLVDSIFSMILPTGINITFLLILVKTFKSVPKSLIESARMDGANDIGILVKVLLPIAKPTITAIALYYAVERWNEWYLGMLYINSSDLRPFQLVLRNIIASTNSSSLNELLNNIGIAPFAQGVKMACTIVATMPIVILYPLLQKYFLTGITMGAVKE